MSKLVVSLQALTVGLLLVVFLLVQSRTARVEKDEGLKQTRILTIYTIREVLKTTLSLMGIPQPERM